MNATTTQTRRNRNTRGSTQNATTPLPFQTLETMGFVTGTPAPPAEPARRLRRLRPLREIQPTMDDFSTEFVTPDPKILARLKELRQELRSKRRAILLASQYKKVETRYDKKFRALAAGKRDVVIIERREMRFSEAFAIAVRYPSKFLLTVNGSEYWTMTPQNAWRLKTLFEKLDRGELDEENTELIETSDNAIYEILIREDAVLTFELAPTGPRTRATGGFFKHINLTKFDLKRYGIFQNEAEIESEGSEDNCLFIALHNGGFPEDQLDTLRYALQTRDIPEY